MQNTSSHLNVIDQGQQKQAKRGKKDSKNSNQI
jgi:hypothetical protein